MTEFDPQSTDRINENTNPRVSNVVLEGSETMSMNYDAGDDEYSGGASVVLPLDTDYANLDIEAWIKFQQTGGSNAVAYYKMPVCRVDVGASGGTPYMSAWITVTSPVKAGTYNINFNFWFDNSVFPYALIDPIVSYRIKTDKVSADGLTFES